MANTHRHDFNQDFPAFGYSKSTVSMTRGDPALYTAENYHTSWEVHELERRTDAENLIQSLAKRYDTSEEVIRKVIADWQAGRGD